MTSDSAATDLNALLGQRNARTTANGWMRRLVQLPIARILRGRDAYQQQVDASVADQLSLLHDDIQQIGTDLSRLDSNVAILNGKERDAPSVADFVQLIASINETFREHLEWLIGVKSTAEHADGVVPEVQAGVADVRAGLSMLTTALQGVGERIRSMSARQADLERELRSIPYMSEPAVFTGVDSEDRSVLAYRTVATDDRYAAFEDLFRGPEELIRERQKVYLGILSSHPPVVDIGSGRGEVLDLLAAEGIAARGVDADLSMVERTRRKGHDVRHEDALTFLESLKDDSVGAVFAAQVIEHLSYDTLVGLIRESRRVLHQGGLLIMETVNPYSIAAFRTFWTDLTHRAPIFPEVLLALTRQADFEQASVLFPNGTGDLDIDRWREGEYAVIACKQTHIQ